MNQLMQPRKQRKDLFITSVIKICGYSSILFVGLILVFLLKEGLPALKDVPLSSLDRKSTRLNSSH